MASYNLILDTKFKPFTYDEMLKPVADATAAHKALESEYNDLAVKASVWEGMANEEKDPETFKIYKKYADDLRSWANLLATQGLNPLSERGMLTMRTRYGSEIVPIEQAYKRRDTLDKEESDAKRRDETLRFKRRARDISLDEFRKNPMLGHDESFSGRELTNTVANAVSSYVNAAIDKGDLKALGLPYQYTQDIQYGATPDQVYRVMQKLYDSATEGEPEAVKWLMGIRDQAIYNTGVLDWKDPDAVVDAIAFANLGLTKAIGKTVTTNYTDQAGLTAYENSLREQAEERRFIREHPELYAPDDGLIQGLDPNVHSLYMTSDIADKNKDKLTELEAIKTIWLSTNFKAMYKSAFDSPGVKGYKGKEEMRDPIYGTLMEKGEPSSPGLSKYGITKETYNKYVKRIKSQGQEPMNEWDWVAYMTDYNIDKLKNNIGNPYTDYHSLQIKSDEDSQYIARQMTSQVGSEGNIQKITGLHEDSEGNVNIETQSILAPSFTTTVKAYPIISVNNMPKTGEQFVTLSNGEYYKIPVGTFSNYVEKQLSDVNDRIVNASSEEERFIEMNRGNSYLQAIINKNTGSNNNYGSVIMSNKQN